jgi:hypothetical protein
MPKINMSGDAAYVMNKRPTLDIQERMCLTFVFVCETCALRLSSDGVRLKPTDMEEWGMLRLIFIPSLEKSWILF